jgi:hypothetical protein
LIDDIEPPWSREFRAVTNRSNRRNLNGHRRSLTLAWWLAMIRDGVLLE